MHNGPDVLVRLEVEDPTSDELLSTDEAHVRTVRSAICIVANGANIASTLAATITVTQLPRHGDLHLSQSYHGLTNDALFANDGGDVTSHFVHGLLIVATKTRPKVRVHLTRPLEDFIDDGLHCVRRIALSEIGCQPRECRGDESLEVFVHESILSRDHD
jgi:hypothetical protein